MLCSAVKMVRYSYREQVEMIFAYGQAQGNGRAAARIYQDKYPHRQQPNHNTFGAIFRRLCETGSFDGTGERGGRVHYVRTPDLKERVLQDIENNPSVSTRQVSRQYEICQTIVLSNA